MKKTDNTRNIFTKTILVLACISIIVWALPRESGPSLVYDVDHPWMYPSLIATFDFPVLKDTVQLRQERDSILLNQEPYYNYDASVAKKQIERFYAEHGDDEDIPSELKSHIAQSLEHVYENGIVTTMEYNEIIKDTTNQIRVVKGKDVMPRRILDVYSVMMAYEHIFDDPIVAKYRSELQDLELNDYLLPNVIFDSARNQEERRELLATIPVANGMVLSGQKIIDRGEMVNARTYQEISSYEQEMKKRSSHVSSIPSTLAGQVLFVAIMIVIMTLYLSLFRKDYFEKPRSLMLLYFLVTLFPVLVSLMMRNTVLSVYLLPFAIVPIFIRIFMDSRTAFVANVVTVLICAAAVKYQYEFIIVQIVCGAVAIFSMRNLTQRSELFKTTLLITVASCLTYFSLQLMQDNTISELDHTFYKYFFINGVLLLFVYPLMLVVEKVFGFTSEVTLIELSNTSKPLLRKLSEVAPGTFQHSIMVGNLAAEIANKIGAKAQLVRTGALYHDIGKMTTPHFFTENQRGANPLESMDRKKAAKTVVSHVIEGLRIAEKENMPMEIQDFIRTHHGAGMAKYFYITYCNEHPDEEVDKTDFSYPGPNPQTKEQAILMMTDAIEAASRSLKEYTEENIRALVNNIIDGQLQAGHFLDCPLNFHDIRLAKEVLIERLMSIYHTRISYPKLQKESQGEK